MSDGEAATREGVVISAGLVYILRGIQYVWW